MVVSQPPQSGFERCRGNQEVFFALEKFERLIDPFPTAEMATPPRGFLRFMWSCTAGVRPYILAMALLTACIGAFEAYLFGLLGDIVDWLGSTPPQQLWAEQRGRLFGLAGLVMGSTVLVLLQTMFKHQTLAGNFPMRLRWNFHRLMLGQSMSFYQDEFAWRCATRP